MTTNDPAFDPERNRLVRLANRRALALRASQLSEQIPQLLDRNSFNGRWTRRHWGQASIFASLGALVRYPADILKIDRSFINAAPAGSRETAIVRAMIAMGHQLGMKVIANGVETEAQREFLASSGCHYWQGFLFSQPKPIAEFETWTRAYGAARSERSHV